MNKTHIVIYALSAIYLLYAHQYAIGFTAHGFKRNKFLNDAETQELFYMSPVGVRALICMIIYVAALISFPVDLVARFQKTRCLIAYGGGYMNGFITRLLRRNKKP